MIYFKTKSFLKFEKIKKIKISIYQYHYIHNFKIIPVFKAY